MTQHVSALQPQTERVRRQQAPFNRLKAATKRNPICALAPIPAKGLPREYIALKVDGYCLAPRVRHGQAVIAERKLPKPGELAVFWFKGADRPSMKILRTPIDLLYPYVPGGNCVALIEVEQLNPPQRAYIPINKIDCIGVHSVTKVQS